MTTDLSGKVAFVTGGAHGIGAVIVQRLARDGAAVGFTYKGSAAQAREVAASVEAAGGRAIAIQADVAMRLR
jgi:3-oxoacyl-[acyl-carrier protein] reductase